MNTQVITEGRTTLTNKITMIFNFFNNLLMRLIFLYLDYRFGAKFNSIKSKTSLLSTNANLSDLFNHVVNLYHVEYKEKGLSGIYKLRQSVLAQINGLTISKF